MSISVVSTSYNSSTGSTNTVTKPTGVIQGETLIAIIAQVGNGVSTPTFTPPSGFTLRASIAPGISNVSVSVYTKLTDSGDESASSYVFTHSSVTNQYSVCGLIFATGLNGSNVLDTSNSGNNSASSISISGITPSVVDTLILFATATTQNGRTFSSQAIATDNITWTEAFDQSGATGTSLAVAYGVRPQTTATGNATTSISGGSSAYSAIILSLKPRLTDSLSDSISLADSKTTAIGLSFNESIEMDDSTESEKGRLWVNKQKTSTTWNNKIK